MIVFTWNMIQQISAGKKPVPTIFSAGTALTIGSFDGPHIGHEALFDTVLTGCRDGFAVPGIITFARPLSGLKSPSTYSGDISTLAQRLERCSDKGFLFAVVIDFSDEFGRMKGRVFLSVLKKCCKLKLLVEGRDFHCGFHGEMDIHGIRRFAADNNFNVEIVDPVLYGGERVSSSRIRQDIMFGDFEPAAYMLRHPYRLDCTGLNRVQQKNEVCFFADENLIQVLPADGIYNARVIMSGGRTVKTVAPAVSSAEYTYEVNVTVGSQILRLKVPADTLASSIRAIEFISECI